MRLAGLGAAALIAVLPITAPAAPLAAAQPSSEALAAIVAPMLPVAVTVATVHITRDRDGIHREAAAGSGFIIDPAGLIVTNNHVVDGADEISVTLHDNTVLPATLVGQDDLTDLAVLKVRSEAPLPAAIWGDSDALQIGEPVIAIGNPYAIGTSASAGIISALGRDMKEGPYDDYIQTDAALNHGNSGGPMFDLRGHVVGINAVVYSPTEAGGSVGIGFAIPSNEARFVVAQIVHQGFVRRGWLGARIQDLTPAIADGVGLSRPQGAIVVAPVPGSPAAAAGLESGDVVLSFAGRPVSDFRALSRAVATEDIGAAVPVTVWRNGREQTLTVIIAERPGDRPHAAPPPALPAASAPTDIGLHLSVLTATARARYKLPANQSGALVTAVMPGSAAANQGIRAGDVILRVLGQPTASAEAMLREISEQRRSAHDHVLILVQDPNGVRWVALRVA